MATEGGERQRKGEKKGKDITAWALKSSGEGTLRHAFPDSGRACVAFAVAGCDNRTGCCARPDSMCAARCVLGYKRTDII